MNYQLRSGHSNAERFAIVGFDNLNASSLIHPPLSTIFQNFHEIGKLAMEHLIAIMEGEAPIVNMTVPVELIVRESCTVNINS